MALLRPSTYDLLVDKNFIEIGETYEDIMKNDKEHLDASVFVKLPTNATKTPGIGGGLKYRHDGGDSAHIKGSIHMDGSIQLGVGGTKRIHTGKGSSLDMTQNVSVTIGLDGGLRDFDISLPRIGF